MVSAEIHFETFRGARGFLHDHRFPPLLCSLKIKAAEELQQAAEEFRARLCLVLPSPPPEIAISKDVPNTGPAASRLLDILGEVTALFQEAAGIPVVDRTVVTRQPNPFLKDREEQWLLVLPAVSQDAAAVAFRHVIDLFRDNLSKRTEVSNLADVLETIFSEIEIFAPGGSNNRNMVREAVRMGLPVSFQPGGIIQYGWGVNSHWFKGSVSESTGALAASVCSDKRQTHALLAHAGLPVARQREVKSSKDVMETAEAFGYPVVLKAVDMEQGKGVVTGIHDEQALREAFTKLKAFRRPVVLEKFVKGQDYRVNVLHGHCETVTLRIPAGVEGDGRSTIRALVDAANEDPRRSDKRFSVMKPIRIDQEALTLLARQNMTQATIPGQGVFVPLRNTANVTTGGTTMPITENIHPDNIFLAENAAQVLRIELAGVDLLLPDIARSWKETGGVICEVNAGPQIGLAFPEVITKVLSRFVPNKGRIPVDCILTDEPAVHDAVLRGLAVWQKRQTGQGDTVCIAGGDVYINGYPRLRAPDIHKATSVALGSSTTGRVAVVLDPDAVLKHGAVVENADRLFVIGWDAPANKARRLMQRLEPHISNAPIIAEEDFGRIGLETVSSMSCRTLPRQTILEMLEMASGVTGRPGS